MDLVILLLQIISLAKVKDSNIFLLNEVFSNLRSHNHEITRATKGYIEWFIINKVYSNIGVSGNSPS